MHSKNNLITSNVFEKERATKKININITYLHLQTTFFNKESKFLSQEKVSEVIQKVPLLRRGGGTVIEKRTKTNREKGCPSMSAFLKKLLRFSKWSFTVFLLIIMAVWNIKQTIMKDCNIQSCQWMGCDRFRQSTQDHQSGLC